MTYNFDLQKFYDLFDRIKSQKEYLEYCKEMQENNRILNEKPFNYIEADNQVKKLINKYEAELNAIALLLQNGMKTTTVNTKAPEQIRGELQYVNSCIPLIALIQTMVSEELNKIIEKIINDNNIQ